MSRGTGRVIDFCDALEIVLREASRLAAPQVERLDLLASLSRVLAQSIAAGRDQPPFDRATRDGFAVHAEEWSSGAKLRVSGQVRAGEVWRDGTIASGQAVEIMTGAPVPAGADAVAMVEHAEHAGDYVCAAPERTVRAGENIVPRGSEARFGDVLLRPGTTMTAAEIALSATCDCAEVAVYQRPLVVILATGDELAELGESLAPHQIRNSNSYALAALVIAAAGEPQRLPIARDLRDDLRARIKAACTADLLLLSGGVSAGKYDLVEDVLSEFGAEFFFTGVRMQPGKPVVFGRMPKAASQRVGRSASEQKPSSGGPGAEDWLYFFGLPGNPISTEVTFHGFVRPFLRALCGVGSDSLAPNFAQATLTEDVPAKPGLTRLLPAYLTHLLEKPTVGLVHWQGSGDLAANARANCYAVLPDGRDLRAGDVITVLLR